MATWDVTTAAASLLFDTDVGTDNSCFSIDSNHFINFWQGAAGDGFVQVFTVNTTTWAVTTASAQLEFDTQNSAKNACFQIDSNHFINFWLGGAATTDGFVQVFTVNTSTWAVTTAAASKLFDTDVGNYNSCYQIDANHFINFWQGAAGDGFTQVFTVNTTTWAVTTAAARLEFDTQDNLWNKCIKIDTNHFVNVWQGPAGDGFVQVFTVNTTTWAVTTAAASLEFDTQNMLGWKSVSVIDGNHFIVFWKGGAATTDAFVQVFTVNTTTWAVTTAAASLLFDTDVGTFNACVQVDANHFINFWTGLDADGYVQTFEVNTTTWAVTTASAQLEFDTQNATNNACLKIDSSHFVNFWLGGAATTDGFVQVFTVEIPVVGGSSVKDIISSTDVLATPR